MSIEKKRRPSDEDGAARPAKKARTFEEVKEKRREKKEKKKELKREKREKKENGHRGPGEKKEKRQNKYEKEKKMRLEKKEKRAREKALSAKNEGSEQKQQPEKQQPEKTHSEETQSEETKPEETKPQKTKSAKTKPQKTQTQTERVPAENGHTGPSPSMGAYTQTDALTALPESEIQTFLKTEQVAIFDPLAKKDDAAAKLRPLVSFAHLPVTDLTKQQPFAAYTKPTPIQAASWPFSLAGRDLVGIAETGSGKTMAFALPCVEALRVLPKPAPVAAEKLPNRSPHRRLPRVLLRQAGGVDVIVATPGRLKDFLNDGAVSLAHVRFAVLDEADRMLDTGFEEDIKAILGACPARGERQTLMFTATWPASVRGLADGFMVDPVKVTGGGRRGRGC
ncbi:ATP-dependent RNA helicase dbp3 [Niveomyces insectorum RCEF 264]|uniref:ATP-dependent RNA helicase dbp3 n=1 Tax=Niveomyces insectorum RCEF 264 TaxID=1081102 RepID=A0A162K581_9HYPO|nr:ATP-dependent RNA helicase dbp3 [Niveomyces insectorum RCEF 264]